jgi:hypothetical protein
MSRWSRGKATDCNPVYVSSNLTRDFKEGIRPDEERAR